MCQSPDVGVLDKLRLLMVFIISQGAIQESTRRELMKVCLSAIEGESHLTLPPKCMRTIVECLVI